jgi:hypothetical protein
MNLEPKGPWQELALKLTLIQFSDLIQLQQNSMKKFWFRCNLLHPLVAIVVK